MEIILRPRMQHHAGSAPHAPAHQHRTRTSIQPDDRMGWTTWWLWRGARTRSHPELGRENPQRPWYCVSRRGRVGRRQVFQPIHPRSIPVRPLGAGWSSPVARQAHNLKVTGSNPVPATSDSNTPPTPPFAARVAGVLLLAPIRRTAAPGPSSMCRNAAQVNCGLPALVTREHQDCVDQVAQRLRHARIAQRGLRRLHLAATPIHVR